ncbi:hypothetical protein WICPIJ_002882 [Wickerhamomyces pijperi]|uniref:tRNA ligase kinase domain-containing protein n=1 Tax=Wickerhamomyces pijperi TaxID=599730 RepID=A0A9P8QAZ6_WICPI|nr:hypothetical protein WICPIJ_002882 [Wickerhamomyces pijperi]
MSSITSTSPSMNPSNNVEKKKKYLIITVSLISGYKTQILEILNQLIPNSVFQDCSFKRSPPPALVLEKQLGSLLEQDQIDCVLLRKNNQMGLHRDIIKQAVDQINNNPNNDSFHIELVLIDLIGNMKVHGPRFMNGIFTRVMMRNEPETTINPGRYTPREIASIVRSFCSGYQSVPRMQQQWQFDLIIVLDYTKPNLFRFVRCIVDEINGQYPELIKDVADDVILRLTEPGDLRIERLERQIEKFGFLDMKQFVQEHGDENGIPDWLQQRLEYGCTDDKEENTNKKKKVHILYYIGVQFNGVQDIFNEITAHYNITGKCIQTTILEFEQLINGTAEQQLFDFDHCIITEPISSTSIEKLLTRTATHDSKAGGSTVQLIGLNFLPKSENTQILDQYYKSILRYQLRNRVELPP